MNSFWFVLDRALQMRTRGSDSGVADRVGEALSKWTHRAESDLAYVGPLRVNSSAVVGEQEEPCLKCTQTITVSIEGSPSAPDRSEPQISEYQPEFSHADWTSEPVASEANSYKADYYEILQISRTAEPETIHRVYRIMAARFHPDNAMTGNMEKFLILHEAYEVLSKPNLRAEYDRSIESWASGPLSVFGQKGFIGGHRTEINRRLGVLSLLYNRRRMSDDRPGTSMLDLERVMSLPREYLQFTLWYLKSKAYITVEDHSEYCITSAGVDYLEDQSGKNKLIRELLIGEAGPEQRSLHGRESTKAIEGEGATVAVRKVRRARAARRTQRALIRRTAPAATAYLRH